MVLQDGRQERRVARQGIVHGIWEISKGGVVGGKDGEDVPVGVEDLVEVGLSDQVT